MRLAMVIGEQRLALEQRMLNRLAVGLMAEGAHLTRIVPENWATALLGEGERRMELAPRVEARMSAMRWTRRAHVRRVADALSGNPPEILYLLGRDAWSFGLELAVELDCPAILEAWSAAQAHALPRPVSQPNMLAVTAPCEGIAKVVRSRVGADMTALVPMGVSSPPHFAPVLADGERPPAAAVIGGCRDVSAYAAVLTGLARVLQKHPSLQVFMELRGPHEHEIWRLAEKVGLISAVSAISSASQHHALLTRCDLAILPEHYGELRSVLLEAMSMAIVVVAGEDPALDMLVDGETARLVRRRSAEGWTDAIEAVLDDPAGAQALGRGGRDHILRQHRSSDQVEGLSQLLTRLARRDTYAFPTPGG